MITRMGSLEGMGNGRERVGEKMVKVSVIGDSAGDGSRTRMEPV